MSELAIETSTSETTATRRRRRARRIAVVAVLLVTAWLALSLAVAYALTRRPRGWFAEPPPPVPWGRLEPTRIRTADGHELGAWFAEGEPDAPSVLLLHGNGGSRRNCLDRAAIHAGQGCAVLLVSLRAHGDSPGEFNDIGYSARHDVVAATEFLERRRPGRPVLVHGTSMGAAAAIFAAGTLGGRVRGYILECPYRDLRTAVWNRAENALPPIVDRVAYLGLSLVAPLVLPELEKISPLEAIGAVPADVPVLILAGGRDRNARPDEARALYERVKSHGTLAIFESADHVRLHDTQPERYRTALLEMLGRIRR